MAEILVTGPTVHELHTTPPSKFIETKFSIVDDSKKPLFNADYYENEGEKPFFSVYWPSSIQPEAYWPNVEAFSQELEAELGVHMDYGVYHSGEKTAVGRPLSAEGLSNSTVAVYGEGFMRIYGNPISFIYDSSGFVSDRPYVNFITSLDKPDQLCQFIQGNSDGNIPGDLVRDVLTQIGTRSQARLAELTNASTKTQA